jgi:hypothetical protein
MTLISPLGGEGMETVVRDDNPGVLFMLSKPGKTCRRYSDAEGRETA